MPVRRRPSLSPQAAPPQLPAAAAQQHGVSGSWLGQGLRRTTWEGAGGRQTVLASWPCQAGSVYSQPIFARSLWWWWTMVQTDWWWWCKQAAIGPAVLVCSAGAAIQRAGTLFRFLCLIPSAPDKMAEFLQVSPHKLVFRLELGQQSACSVTLQVRQAGRAMVACSRCPAWGAHRPAWASVAAAVCRHVPPPLPPATQPTPLLLPLQNPTDERLAFKVKTTAPAKYSVRPALPLLNAPAPAAPPAGTPCRHLLAAAPAWKPDRCLHLTRFSPLPPCRPSLRRGCWSRRPASSWQSPAAPPSSCLTGWPTARWVVPASEGALTPTRGAAANTADQCRPSACCSRRCRIVLSSSPALRCPALPPTSPACMQDRFLVEALAVGPEVQQPTSELFKAHAKAVRQAGATADPWPWHAHIQAVGYCVCQRNAMQRKCNASCRPALNHLWCCPACPHAASAAVARS